jgi:two-component sensor histidine kinase
LRVLVDELSHRVKNTLAVVQSITEQTFRTGSDSSAIRQALIGRLHALAETHTLLTRANWESVNIAELVERATNHLAVAEAGRFVTDGPDVKLTPKASLALGLVLHELSTNAVKHGAWASGQGSVTVCWRLAESNLVVEWEETTADSVVPPKTAFQFRQPRRQNRSLGAKLRSLGAQLRIFGLQGRNHRIAARHSRGAISAGCVVGHCHRHVDSYSLVTCQYPSSRL